MYPAYHMSQVTVTPHFLSQCGMYAYQNLHLLLKNFIKSQHGHLPGVMHVLSVTPAAAGMECRRVRQIWLGFQDLPDLAAAPRLAFWPQGHLENQFFFICPSLARDGLPASPLHRSGSLQRIKPPATHAARH